MKALAIAVAMLVTSIPAAAQWLRHPTPGIPRTADGRPDLRAPAPITEGVRVDLGVLAAGLESRASRLDDALSSVRREEREAQSSLSSRDQAFARWERTYAGVAEVLTGLCTLAGLDDLAAKVRPTARRRAGAGEGGGEAT